MKRVLQLTDDQYSQAYTHFQRICINRGILQKAGTDRDLWQAALDDLVAQNTDINLAINVRQCTAQEIRDRKAVLDCMCRKALKPLRNLPPGHAPAHLPPPHAQHAPGFQPGPGPHPPLSFQPARDHYKETQPAPRHQRVLGYQPAFPQLADPVFTITNGNKVAARGAYGHGALYVPFFQPPPPPAHHQNPHQAFAQRGLPITNGHGGGGWAYDYGMPIDPVLLAYDAGMRQRAVDSREVVGWNGEADMGMDVDMEEEI
ncbi:hypothetical protein MMC30_006965 [Trapelia coarctata]|nr:hypothetical protein [Trapelia coarctata]